MLNRNFLGVQKFLTKKHSGKKMAKNKYKLDFRKEPLFQKIDIQP